MSKIQQNNLNTIKHISTIVNSSLELDELLSKIMSVSADITEAETSSLMLLDEKTNELYFSVVTGSTSEKLKEIRIPADKGVAGWVATHNESLLVEDVTKDSRFHSGVDEKSKFHTKSILCIPLCVKEKIIGVIEVLNKKNNKVFDKDDTEMLSVVAHMAAISIENARLHKESLEKEKFKQEISIAQNLQTSILPKKFSYFDNVDISGKSIPARIAGGDFFDCIKINDEEIIMLIADVAGKGVGAASLMLILMTFIRSGIASTHGKIELIKLLYNVNDFMVDELAVDLFVTLFALKYNIKTNEIEYVNAGHNQPLLYSQTRDEFEFLKADGIVLGILPGIELVSNKRTLTDDEILILYTDGITESINTKDVEFGEDRLMEVIKKNHTLPSKDLRKVIFDAVNNFCYPAEQFDDLTLLILKKKEV
jgi:sigma-B regulation protein RsbU (phosphoserine phosphatase)